MTSATYIPLTQVSPQEYAWSPARHRPGPASIRAHLTRRRAIYALIATSSLLTLLLFLKLSATHHDDLDDDFEYVEDLSYQPTYIAIPVPDALPAAARPRLRPVRDLPAHCLDAYYASGQLCHDSYGPIPMDVLWTWVNGSDPLFVNARERTINAFAPDDPYRPLKKNNPARMFRDHDELRHSIRSVLANFRPYTNRFRILTSDFFYPEKGSSNHTFPDPGAGYWRLGLQPQWLQTADHSTQWQDGNVQLSLTHHAHFFDPYNDTIFNSYAIETQFAHLQDVSESFIYMNDDFYMMASLTPVSFYTSPYGIVIRLQEGLQVSPDRPHKGVEGEWRSMGESNWLLSNRFGRRTRPYVVHEAKAVSFAILQEIALVWPDALAKSATHAFRETAGGDGDFYQMFVHAHYIVERAREALLWAWVVGRLGGLDDTWSSDDEARAWREMGGMDEENELRVEAYPRETLHTERVMANLKEAGYETNVRTEYIFSSLDGYAYGHYDKKTRNGFPTFGVDDTRPECAIKRDECFSSVKGADGAAPRASDVFKHIAFERTECGDCAILALVKASGPLGLGAFLPPEDRRVHIEDPSPTPEGFIPHLPLVDDWHAGHFALQDVMREAHTTNIRDWALMLLQRYRYVVGETPSIFERLLSYPQVRNALREIDQKNDLALLCVNDDLGRDDERVGTLFYDWQEKRWPTPAAWEASDAAP